MPLGVLGEDVVCSSDLDDHDALLVEDLLTYDVYLGARSGHVIWAKRGGCQGQFINVSLLLSKHTKHELKCLRCTELSFEVPLTAYVFKWPKKGAFGLVMN